MPVRMVHTCMVNVAACTCHWWQFRPVCDDTRIAAHLQRSAATKRTCELRMASVKAHSSNMAHADAWERLTTDHRRAWLQDGPRQPWKAKQRSVAAAPLTPGRATCSHHPAGLPAISDAYVHRSLSSLFASRPLSSYGAQQQFTGTHKRLSLPRAQPHSCMPSLSLSCKTGARYQTPALHRRVALSHEPSARARTLLGLSAETCTTAASPCAASRSLSGRIRATTWPGAWV